MESDKGMVLSLAMSIAVVGTMSVVQASPLSDKIRQGTQDWVSEQQGTGGSQEVSTESLADLEKLGLSRQGILAMSTSEVSDFLHQAATSDSARARARANQQRQADFINYLMTHPYAMVKTVDAPRFAYYESSERWKLFLSDYGLSDFSNISYSRAAQSAETIMRESVATGAGDPGGNATPVLSFVQETGEQDSVVPESFARSARTLVGAVLTQDGELVGTIEIKTSRARTKQTGERTFDMTVQVTALLGKKARQKVKGISLSGGSNGSVIVPGWGAAQLVMSADGAEFVGMLGDCVIVSGTVGGVLPSGTGTAYVDFSGGFGSLGDVIPALLPVNAAFAVSARGTWAFSKSSGVKIVASSADGWNVSVDQSRGKTNLSGIKLSYKPKTGRFSGSFKLYELNTSSAKPRLKKQTVKVSGVVVNGIGTGVASISKLKLSWPVTIE